MGKFHVTTKRHRQHVWHFPTFSYNCWTWRSPYKASTKLCVVLFPYIFRSIDPYNTKLISPNENTELAFLQISPWTKNFWWVRAFKNWRRIESFRSEERWDLRSNGDIAFGGHEVRILARESSYKLQGERIPPMVTTVVRMLHWEGSNLTKGR